MFGIWTEIRETFRQIWVYLFLLKFYIYIYINRWPGKWSRIWESHENIGVFLNGVLEGSVSRLWATYCTSFPHGSSVPWGPKTPVTSQGWSSTALEHLLLYMIMSHCSPQPPILPTNQLALLSWIFMTFTLLLKSWMEILRQGVV